MTAVRARVWPNVPVRRLFTVGRGATPTNDPINWGGPHVWLTPEDLSACDGRRVSRSRRNLSDHGLASCSASIAPPGSLILSARAPIGYVVETEVPATTNQGCMSLVPKEQVDPRFFRYQFSAIRPYLEALGQGATFVELGSESLRSLRVPCPPLDQQRRVADALDSETARIDRLISKKREMSRLLGLRLSSLQQNAVLGRGEMFPPLVSTREPALPKLPEGWSPVRLRNVATDVTVGVVVTPAAFYADQGLPFIRGYNVRPGLITQEDLARISPTDNSLHPKSVLRTGDVLVVRTGQAGAAAVVPDWAVGGNCVDVLIVRCAALIRPKFLELVLNSELAARQVEMMSVGAIQSHFNVAALRNLMLPLPSLEDQDRVIEVIAKAKASISQMIRTTDRQVQLLMERRQALITERLRGIDGAGASEERRRVAPATST